MSAGRPFDEEQFAQTIVRVEWDNSWIEFVPVTESSSIRDSSNRGDVSPLPGVLHVISGCNPGYRASDADNDQRHVSIGERLRGLGVVPRPAIGSSPDGTWVESSWAVSGLARESVCSLARQFGQVAIFEIEGPTIRIIRCSDAELMCDMDCDIRRA